MEIALDFTGPVAVFPLPNCVFFPGSRLPLHIFEPRYRTMVADALAGDRLIAIALLAQGWEADPQSAPRISKVATLGRMVRHSPLANGRSNILLEGLARIRPTTEHPGAPYRSFDVEVLSDRVTLESLEQSSALVREIHERVLDLLLLAPPLFAPAVPVPSEVMSPGRYVDRIADSLRIDPVLKQSLLDEVDVIDRGARLLAFLGQIIEVARRRTEQGDGGEADA